MQSGRGIWGEDKLREYYVYIMASHRGTLYIGVTNDLTRRVYEHRNKVAPGFTAKYNVSKLVYFESSDDVASAIARERQIKAWRRSKKVTLLENANLYWDDLASEWFDHPTSPDLSLRSG
jgi:putative endonuclease